MATNIFVVHRTIPNGRCNHLIGPTTTGRLIVVMRWTMIVLIVPVNVRLRRLRVHAAIPRRRSAAPRSATFPRREGEKDARSSEQLLVANVVEKSASTHGNHQSTHDTTITTLSTNVVVNNKQTNMLPNNFVREPPLRVRKSTPLFIIRTAPSLKIPYLLPPGKSHHDADKVFSRVCL